MLFRSIPGLRLVRGDFLEASPLDSDVGKLLPLETRRTRIGDETPRSGDPRAREFVLPSARALRRIVCKCCRAFWACPLTFRPCATNTLYILGKTNEGKTETGRPIFFPWLSPTRYNARDTARKQLTVLGPTHPEETLGGIICRSPTPIAVGSTADSIAVLRPSSPLVGGRVPPDGDEPRLEYGDVFRLFGMSSRRGCSAPAESPVGQADATRVGLGGRSSRSATWGFKERSPVDRVNAGTRCVRQVTAWGSRGASKRL